MSPEIDAGKAALRLKETCRRFHHADVLLRNGPEEDAVSTAREYLLARREHQGAISEAETSGILRMGGPSEAPTRVEPT